VNEDSDTAIIADTGGTTYDVRLVRRGRIPSTRETWIGQPYRGHMTGFTSVDVKSVGAGGGSIAWVDGGGMLHVGPQSAGSVPGPVCYGQGGTAPTVTDASIVLGYLDPQFFLGGSMKLHADLSRAAIARDVAEPLNLTVEEAAVAIISVATENMVQAIMDITVNQGIDPRTAVLVGGGGAAGLNSVLANGGALNGFTLLEPDVLAEAVKPHWDGMDFMTKRPFRLGLGFMLSCPPFPIGGNDRNFGHPGMGGAIAFADPDRRLSFSYAPNRMSPVADAGPYASALIDATYAAVR
jgi:hypothetical protein